MGGFGGGKNGKHSAFQVKVEGGTEASLSKQAASPQQCKRLKEASKFAGLTTVAACQSSDLDPSVTHEADICVSIQGRTGRTEFSLN